MHCVFSCCFVLPLVVYFYDSFILYVNKLRLNPKTVNNDLRYGLFIRYRVVYWFGYWLNRSYMLNAYMGLGFAGGGSCKLVCACDVVGGGSYNRYMLRVIGGRIRNIVFCFVY